MIKKNPTTLMHSFSTANGLRILCLILRGEIIQYIWPYLKVNNTSALSRGKLLYKHAFLATILPSG